MTSLWASDNVSQPWQEEPVLCWHQPIGRQKNFRYEAKTQVLTDTITFICLNAMCWGIKTSWRKDAMTSCPIHHDTQSALDFCGDMESCTLNHVQHSCCNQRYRLDCTANVTKTDPRRITDVFLFAFCHHSEFLRQKLKIHDSKTDAKTMSL